jgi:hypothetical protein
MAKKPNPVLVKAKEEAYNEGFKKGFEMAQDNACYVFASKFEGLQDVPGIGPKLMEKIANHFGREYFEVVQSEKS